MLWLIRRRQVEQVKGPRGQLGVGPDCCGEADAGSGDAGMPETITDAVREHYGRVAESVLAGSRVDVAATTTSADARHQRTSL